MIIPQNQLEGDPLMKYAEPFRIKMIEPIRLIPKEEREKALVAARSEERRVG